MERLHRSTTSILCFVTLLIVVLLSVQTALASTNVKLNQGREIALSSIAYYLEPPKEANLNSPPSPGVEQKFSWKPYDRSVNSGKGFLWLRVPVSASPSGDTHLFLFPAPQYYEVYEDGKLIYQQGARDALDERMRNVIYWDTSPLNHNDSSGYVYVRLKGKTPEMFAIGSEAQLLAYMFRADAINIVVVITMFFAGLMALFLYLYNRQVRLLLYFSLFVILNYSLWPSMTYLMSKQLLFGRPSLISFYISTVEWALIFPSLLLLVREMVDAKYRVWLSGANVVLLTVGFAGIVAFSVQTSLVGLYFPVMGFLSAASLVVIIVCTVLSLRSRRNTELVLLSIGIVSALLLEASLGLSQRMDWVHAINVIKVIRPFAMVIPGALIISRRYRTAHRQAKEYAVSLERMSKQLEEDNRLLEHRVVERTFELEEAHLKLVESMRESATAMAEVAALEERNRIAQEIHDIVGHTLTTTIVQIEAGKRLIQHNQQQAIERMNTSQKLVRQGLDEIRTSVRLLRDAEWNYDLATSLHHVIQETRDHAGVTIECEIDELPNLSMAQKNTIYMALKEGITNGIKHGNSSAFSFTLQSDGSEICFLLKNNGEPMKEEKYGFGLKAMQTQVERLRGTMRVGSHPGWNCILEIRFSI